VGLDLGDRTSRYCILNAEGEVVSEGSVATTQIGLQGLFGDRQQSPIFPTRRVDRKLLVIRAREELMKMRTGLVNSARGLVKPMGERLAACDADNISTYRVKFCRFLAGYFGRLPQPIDALVVKWHVSEIERLSPNLQSETFFDDRVAKRELAVSYRRTGPVWFRLCRVRKRLLASQMHLQELQIHIPIRRDRAMSPIVHVIANGVQDRGSGGGPFVGVESLLAE